MAIAVGTSTKYGPVSQSTSVDLSFAHTVLAGDDRLLLVGLAFNPNAPASVTANTVTYAGQSLTKLDDEERINATSDSVRVELWYLKNPPVGSDNVVIDLASSPDLSTPQMAVAVNLTGVDQTTTFGTSVSADGTDNAPTVAASSASGEVVVDIMAQNPSTGIGPNFTAGAGQTEISQGQISSFGGAMSYEAGAGTTTMSWTSDSAAASHLWAIIAVPVKPSTETSDPIAANTTVAELSVLPLRPGPAKSDFPNRDTHNSAKHLLPSFELSGMLPKLYRIRLTEDGMTQDDIYTLPSVSPPGAMAVTRLPTVQSPNGSLLVTTQGKVVQYPLPIETVPQLTDHPVTARSDDDQGLPTYFRPSAVEMASAPDDDGHRLYELTRIVCVLRNLTRGVDWVGMTYAWDEYGRWAPMQWKTGPELRFEWGMPGRRGAGRLLRIWPFLYDGETVEPVCPEFVTLRAFVEPSEKKPGTQKGLRGDPERS